MIVYLRWPLVVHVGSAAPFGLAWDTLMPNAPDATVGQVWNGTAFASPTANSEEANAATIRQQAAQAFLDNRAFLAITSPTNAQNAAQLKAITRQMNKAMRLVLGDLSGTD